VSFFFLCLQEKFSLLSVDLYIQPKDVIVKGKGLPLQAKVAHGVSGRLRPRIFLTFGITGVVGRQLYSPAAFTPGEIPSTHF